MTIDLHILNNDNLLPRDQVRILRVTAVPYPDRQRVKIEVEVTPFKEQPNLEIVIYDAGERLVTSASVLASMHFKMGFNLHLRGMHNPAGDYHVRTLLYYDNPQSPQDMHDIPLHIPADSPDST